MADIRLGMLADRTPVKIAILIPPDLHQALQDYAAFYEEAYGRREPVQELIPAMLKAFLDKDRGFARRVKRVQR